MRYELTDCEWAAIKAMLPNKPRGVPRVNERRVLNGIFWVLRSGAPWRDLPEDFGPYTGLSHQGQFSQPLVATTIHESLFPAARANFGELDGAALAGKRGADDSASDHLHHASRLSCKPSFVKAAANAFPIASKSSGPNDGLSPKYLRIGTTHPPI
jgi:transposase